MISLCQRGKKNQWGVTQFVLEIKRITDHSTFWELWSFSAISDSLLSAKILSRMENTNKDMCVYLSVNRPI